MSDVEDETVVNDEGHAEHDEEQEPEDLPRKHSERQPVGEYEDEEDEDEEDEDEEDEDEDADEGTKRGKKRHKVYSSLRPKVLCQCHGIISIDTSDSMLTVSSTSKPRLTRMKTKKRMKTNMHEV